MSAPTMPPARAGIETGPALSGVLFPFPWEGAVGCGDDVNTAELALVVTGPAVGVGVDATPTAALFVGVEACTESISDAGAFEFA